MYLKPMLTVVGEASELIAGPVLSFDDAELWLLCPFPWEQGLDE